MRPARFFLPLSTFLMRLGVAFFIYLVYFRQVLELNFQEFEFYLSAILSIFGVLLLFAAFTGKQSMTVLSALILFLFGLYGIFTFSGNYMSVTFAAQLFFTLVSLFFLCNGDKNR